MAIHIGLLIFICILGAGYSLHGVTRKKNIRFLCISLTSIFVIQSIRGHYVGIDTITYINSYLKINTFSTCWEKQNWEKGYILLNQIVGKLTSNNPQCLLACVSLIILTGFGYFIIMNIKDNTTAFWAVFLFMTLNHYLTSMVSLRQYCAMAIGCNTYTVLKKDVSITGFMKAVGLLVLALFFHSSAFVCLIFILSFLVKKIDKKFILLTAIASGYIYFNFYHILETAFGIFTRYYIYSISGHEKFSGMEFGNTYWIFLIGKILIMFLIFRLDPREEENKELYRLLLFSLIGITVSIMTTRVALVWRFGYYFDFFLILLIPETIRRVKKYKLLLNFIVFIAGWSYYFYLLYTNGAQCVPYYTFWQTL